MCRDLILARDPALFREFENLCLREMSEACESLIIA